ncbi:MAG: DUF1329 domain-containing protein [Gammaproteobacteria bacterium]|nr:DUF1329 domain-containing protein [Gammaproteobacteria bacterium]
MFTAVVFALAASNGLAEISAEDAKRLGGDLTPVGAEKAGNADGSIPAWDGGIKSAADAGFPDFKSGGHHPDPYASDKMAFTIDASNMSQYADKLTVGHQAMFKTYDGFKMNVYPTRRSAALPQRIYDATARVSTTAKLTEDGNGVTNSIVGIPFPIPKNGHEAIWNHILRYRGDHSKRNFGQAPMTRSGDYTLVKLVDDTTFVYHNESTDSAGNNMVGMFLQDIQAPPRLAGTVLLVHETLNQNAEPRKAWIYNPGQRRVRRAPNVAFDSPGTAADGLRTSDQFDMYNGSPERYDWKLLGKKEIYVPYNAYKVHSNKLKYDDILKPLHLNPEHLRYELHRVWVVDANLKEGTGHIYKRRTFYIDEDSWQILHVDQYDNRDQLWRVSEGHVINYYDVPVLWTTLSVHYDLQSGRYLAMGLNNEEAFTADFTTDIKSADFTVSALRRSGRR